jgi:hypothetical protein
MSTWELGKASWGGLLDWLTAVEKAKRDGWTSGQIELVLLAFHPVAWLAVAVLLGTTVTALVTALCVLTR